jgi:hypothetical protein
MKPKIYTVRWLPFGFRGMTVPPIGIFIRVGYLENETLIRHEMHHWQQYVALGAFVFYAKYFFFLMVSGYWSHPMEREARAAETKNDSSETKTNHWYANEDY